MKVGFVGCGQLARMMAHAASRLDIDVSFLAEADETTSCVQGLGNIVRVQPGVKAQTLYRDMGCPDVITVEREQVDVLLLDDFTEFCDVRPSPQAVAATQNRLREKAALVKLGLPVAPYQPAMSYGDVVAAAEKLGYPIFVKSAEQGYDGKNQWRLDDAADLAALADHFPDVPCIAESGIDFLTEVSMIGARTVNGDMQFFPMAENHHWNGILLASLAPARKAFEALEAAAREYLRTLMTHWDYVGVLAMEMFVTEEGLMINELAPRVHNSGHWTMNGCQASQFEQHIRAIAGLELMPPAPTGASAMVNVLGDDASIEGYSHPAATAHIYNKTPRPGRKVGHVNFNDDDRGRVGEAALALLNDLYPDYNQRSLQHAVRQ